MTTYTVDLKITGTISSDGSSVPPGGETPPPDQPPVEPPPVEPPPIDLPPTQAPPPDYSKPADIVVGPNQSIKEPADAIGTLPVGGILELEDGVYKKTFHIENEGVTIRSKSGNPYNCYFDGQGGYGQGHRLAWGKGVVHSSKSITIIAVGFRNGGSPQSGTTYSNEAGVWIGDSDGTTPGVITLQRCAFDNNANGVFAGYDANLKLVETECLFGYLASNGHNAASIGAGGGPAHDNYVGLGETDVGHSMFWGCCNGHNVKSRSPRSNVHDNELTQDGGRAFEAPDGGDAKLFNNIIHTRKDRQGQPPAGTYGNSNMIAYCDESSGHGATGMAMGGNTIHVSRLNSVIWATAGTIISKNDTVKYYEDGGIILQGNVQGIDQGSAPPGAPKAPPLPRPPSWATVAGTLDAERNKLREFKGDVRKPDKGPDGWIPKWNKDKNCEVWSERGK